MDEITGKNVSSKIADSIKNQLSETLPDGESVRGIFWATNINPLIQVIVITSSRLLAYGIITIHGTYNIASELSNANSISFDVEKIKLDNKYRLSWIDKFGKSHKLCAVKASDHANITNLLRTLEGIPSNLQQFVKPTVAKAINQPVIYNPPARDEWQLLTKGTVNSASMLEVKKQCKANEKPKFILGEWGGGVLAAFDDRCVVIKKGIGTSLLASSLGGGRVATFDYSSITGIEYNSGIVNGVLEILTPSYHGMASNSVWAKRGKANNAFELSNTLPWTKGFYEQVREDIDWIRSKVTESRRPISSANSSSIADELNKLAELRSNQIISEKEFDDAKAKLLSKL